MLDDDYEEPFDGPDDDLEDEDDDDCALDFTTGQCGAAGTEHCDWGCRYSSSEYYAGSTAWWHARGKLAPWEIRERARIYRHGQPWPKTYRYGKAISL